MEGERAEAEAEAGAEEEEEVEEEEEEEEDRPLPATYIPPCLRKPGLETPKVPLFEGRSKSNPPPWIGQHESGGCGNVEVRACLPPWSSSVRGPARKRRTAGAKNGEASLLPSMTCWKGSTRAAPQPGCPGSPVLRSSRAPLIQQVVDGIACGSRPDGRLSPGRPCTQFRWEAHALLLL